jgi:hypothetical protein
VGINNNNDMKFLIFRNSSTSQSIFPSTSLSSITHGLDSDGGNLTSQVDMFFNMGNAEPVKIELTIKDGEIKSVIKNLTTAINKSNSNEIMIADDVNNKYIIDEITSVTIT